MVACGRPQALEMMAWKLVPKKAPLIGARGGGGVRGLLEFCARHAGKNDSQALGGRFESANRPCGMADHVLVVAITFQLLQCFCWLGWSCFIASAGGAGGASVGSPVLALPVLAPLLLVVVLTAGAGARCTTASAVGVAAALLLLPSVLPLAGLLALLLVLILVLVLSPAPAAAAAAAAAAAGAVGAAAVALSCFCWRCCGCWCWCCHSFGCWWCPWCCVAGGEKLLAGTSGCGTGAAPRQCVTPRGVQPFWGLFGGGGLPPPLG